jgi:hypothetical protein
MIPKECNCRDLYLITPVADVVHSRIFVILHASFFGNINFELLELI